MSARPDVRTAPPVAAPPPAPVATGARLQAVLGVGEATAMKGVLSKLLPSTKPTLESNAQLQKMKENGHLDADFKLSMSKGRLDKILAALPNDAEMKAVFTLAVQIATGEFGGSYCGNDKDICNTTNDREAKARLVAAASTRWEALQQLYKVVR